MTAIIIRLKSLILFGLLLLGLAFVWIGITSLDLYQQAIQPERKASLTAPAVIPAQGDKTTPAQAPETPAAPTQPTLALTPQEQNTGKDNFFSEYRIERDRKRSEQVEILREIVNNANSSAQMRQEAQQKLIKISESLEKESKIENALIAKGFKEAVAVIQLDSVMIIVSSNGLRQDEIARISDIVVKVTGCKMEDVVIVPKSV